MVTGVDDKMHLKNLQTVFKILEESGLRLKKEICRFFYAEVEYLGVKVSREGVSTIEEKIRPIVEAPVPQSVSQLKSFLGMIQYYHRHLPNVAAELEPLHALLRKNVEMGERTN